MEIKNDSFDDLVDDFIAHYGVQGMKWGVRKERKTSGRAKRAKARLAKLAKSSASVTKGAYQRLKKIKHQRDLNKVDAKLLRKKKLSVKDLKNLSKAELQERIDIENKRSQLESMNKSKLKKISEDIGDILGSAAKSTATNLLSKKSQDLVERMTKTGKYDPDTILQKDLTRAKNQKELKELQKGKEKISVLLSKPLSALEEDELNRVTTYKETVNRYKNATKVKRTVYDILSDIDKATTDEELFKLDPEDAKMAKEYVTNLTQIGKFIVSNS